ncbi:hypothetical protein SCG7086_BE_00150 [Chlamydiales bacterium SCGC AG-110-P3]|nr:hypothetical protein SCG7086_BE_00150 [Chlamydiales bacterium SCGC AG-110-P3]
MKGVGVLTAIAIMLTPILEAGVIIAHMWRRCAN